jgi:polysaccharide export outer membrane protein
MGSGDKIKVSVFGQPNMSGEFAVAGDGTVSLPFIGSIRAGGLTVRELEQKIVNRLRPDYLKNPRVSVEVLNFRPFDIIGEVQKPGSYPYRDGMTVINAIAMAGGFTYRAKENQFKIKRAANGHVEKAARDTVVKPGDVIEVLERFF